MTLRKSSAAIAYIAVVATLVCICASYSSQGDIYLAGQTIIRVRAEGEYSSISNRAKAIDKAITKVISVGDTQNPELTVKQQDGLWTLFCEGIKIASVCPEEAKANNLSEKQLAGVWMKQLKKALPQCTPGSKLPASAFQPKEKPAEETEKPAEEAEKPAEEATAAGGETEVETPAPSKEAERVAAVETATEAEKEEEAEPEASVTGAPVLLVRDAFATVRALSEKEYVDQRGEIIQHLLADLKPFITGQVEAGGEQPPAPSAEQKGVAAVETEAEQAKGPAEAATSEEEEEEAAAPPAPAPTATAEETTEEEGGAPAIDPSESARAAQDLAEPQPDNPYYKKVPQKNRIRKKLEAARVPYLKLRKKSRAEAEPVSDLLKSCRKAFARGKYDESERYIDSALKLLGVEYQQ